MEFELHVARRKGAKMRCGITGIQGSGKTMSSLLMAKGLCGGDISKAAVICSENGSADLYEHLGPYSVLPITKNFAPEEYIKRINYLVSQGFEAIIIDSISHEWEGAGGCLDIHRQMCADNKKNSFQAWSEITPRHKSFIDTILNAPVHIILCSRQKVEYSIDVADNGKKTITKLGTKEITREGLAYELTCAFELDKNHNATVTKDRTEIFKDPLPFRITEAVGASMLEWCEMPSDLIAEFLRAKASLAKCNTHEELSELKATLSPQLLNTLSFKREGNKRYADIKVWMERNAQKK